MDLISIQHRCSLNFLCYALLLNCEPFSEGFSSSGFRFQRSGSLARFGGFLFELRRPFIGLCYLNLCFRSRSLSIRGSLPGF